MRQTEDDDDDDSDEAEDDEDDDLPVRKHCRSVRCSNVVIVNTALCDSISVHELLFRHEACGTAGQLCW